MIFAVDMPAWFFTVCRGVMELRGYTIFFSLSILVCGFWACAGCRGNVAQYHDPVLIQVGGQSVTVNDFKTAFETAKTACAVSDLKDSRFLNQMMLGVLNQLTEELILLNRANELGLDVTVEELENAVGEIRTDYPDDTFNRTLIEAAIPLRVWKDGLKKRLLVERVVKADLEDRVLISPGDVDEFFSNEPGTASATDDSNPDAESVLRRLRRKKAQEEYGLWISGLRDRYTISIDEDLMEKIRQLYFK
jgi:hypothetical protein